MVIERSSYMFQSYEEIKAYIQKEGITTVDFKYTDLNGKLRHLTLPASELSEKVVREGEGFDASSTSGLKSVESGDMVIIPDIKTGFLDPFWDTPTLSFLCRIADAETKEFFHMDPRGVAYRAQAYMEKTGIADESLWGPEFEFYLISSLFYKSGENGSMYYMGTDENNWDHFEGMPPLNSGGTIKITDHDGYHAHPPTDIYCTAREEMVQLIQKCGFKIRYHHHEVSAASQHEIEVQPIGLTQVGDMGQIIKYIIKMVAKDYGLQATFMPKPLYNRAGSGMHFHQFMKKNGNNVFFKRGNYADLSETALYYIGGILKHGRAITAFMNPSTNSYKRLVPGFEAPTALVYSKGNRSAAIRIPKNFTSEEDKRMEYRPGDATCNMYLAVSAMLMAGLDGIENKIHPDQWGMGPYDGNLETMPKNKLKKITHVPGSLEEALDALKRDNAFLLNGEVFNMEIIESYIKLKEKEILQIRNRTHPKEVDLYFNC